MTSVIAKYISKRVLGESLQNNFGKEDPYFETVPATRLDGRPSSKGKKRRKALPPGISEHDAKILTKVKRRAYRLDMSLFNCCGIRFGWSSVIGIIPAHSSSIGDVIDAFMAMMVLRTCQQVEGGLPAAVKSKMMFNIVLDFGIGLVPFLGDIADALFRANTRNAVELEKYLRQKGAKALKAQGQNALPLDPTDPDEFDQMMRAEHGPPPQYTTGPSRQGTQAGHGRSEQAPPQPARPQPAANKGSGWLGRSKQSDEERGQGPLTSSPNDDPRRNKSTLQKNRY
ncbi:PH domain-containing protein [Mollisia scopiformis]|uniref:PH domain-containing protein n=1 Tax=Mollisia scopiformis TaxID=149040 RepID=A0A194XP61_MOLSC|nr:PH domain-containing protein [Mollisia scopiformis]KUJ21951.1 PH domain-containing protein [Mollisia scopiformis]